jgi:hypothetical protein
VPRIPDPPEGIDRAEQARIARRRLYPVTLLYSGFTLATLGLGISTRWSWAVACFAGGVLVWTLVEYFVHRYVLHGIFPDGRGLRRLLHKCFDGLHWEHHKRPWDGRHINGTIRDTLPFVGPIGALSFLIPVHTLPVFLAGLVQAYIVEEWVHQSVHMYDLRDPYFRYIKRHHCYHHTERGADLAFGLTNGVWDAVLGTSIPQPDKARVHDPNLPTPYTSEAARS